MSGLVFYLIVFSFISFAYYGLIVGRNRYVLSEEKLEIYNGKRRLQIIKSDDIVSWRIVQANPMLGRPGSNSYLKLRWKTEYIEIQTAKLRLPVQLNPQLDAEWIAFLGKKRQVYEH